MLNFLFSNPEKAHPCMERIVWRITRENQFRGLGCRPLEEPGQKKPSKHLWCAIVCIRGKETPWGIVTKFCMWVDIHDVITYATFGDDRLRGLGVVGVEFPISHWLASSPLQHSRTTVRVCELLHYRASVWWSENLVNSPSSMATNIMLIVMWKNIQ